jgi:hypothetical protein
LLLDSVIVAKAVADMITNSRGLPSSFNYVVLAVGKTPADGISKLIIVGQAPITYNYML